MASNERSALNLKKFCSRKGRSLQPLDTARIMLLSQDMARGAFWPFEVGGKTPTEL